MNENNTRWIPVPENGTIVSQNNNTEPKKQRRLLPFEKKDGIFAIIILILSLFTVDSVLFSGYNLGFSVSFLLITVVCALYCRSKNEAPTLFSLFCFLSAVLTGASFTVFNDSFVTFCGTVLILILFAAGLLDISKQNSYHSTDERSIFDIFRFWFKLPFKKVGITLSSLFAPKENKKSAGLGIIFAGIFSAVPLAMIVFALLASSDAAFEAFIEKIIFTDSISEVISSIIFGTGFFILFFSVIFSLAKKDAKAEPSKKSNGSLPSKAVTAFLSVISFVYILYMVSQITYFFNAFWGILPENFNYSNYARRGFFEMCIICFINLSIIVVTLSTVKKNDKDSVPSSVKAVSTFIAAFSFLLTVTAISKMFMYMDEHGLTRKRIITSVFMIVMLIVLIVTVLKIFLKKLPSVKIIITAIAVVGLVVCFTDIDTTVAKYNTEKYLSGEITTDAGYMYELSDSAVPYILEIAKSDTPLANDAKEYLKDRFVWYFSSTVEQDELDFDLQEYNYSRQRAKELLSVNRDIFYPLVKY